MAHPVILRALWGDSTMRKQNREWRTNPDRGEPYEALRGLIVDAVQSGQPVGQCLAFGPDNQNFMLGLGLDCRMVSELAWASPRRTVEQYPEDRHWSLVWGWSTWWHKLRAIEYALGELGLPSILWIDWRVRLNHSAMLNSWLTDLEAGQPFRACLIRQRSTGWAARWRYSNAEPLAGVSQLTPEPAGRLRTPESHYLVGGGLLYFRGSEGLSIVRSALALNEQHPLWTDQQCLAGAIDQMNGRWIGIHRWRRRYELPGYYYPRNRWYTREQDAIWQCGEFLPKQDYRWALWK